MDEELLSRLISGGFLETITSVQLCGHDYSNSPTLTEDKKKATSSTQRHLVLVVVWSSCLVLNFTLFYMHKCFACFYVWIPCVYLVLGTEHRSSGRTWLLISEPFLHPSDG